LSIDTARVTKAAATASTVIVRRGMGPLGWLTVIFVLLKLFEVTAVANWSWWLVLLPLYGPFALVMGIWLAIIAIIVVVFLCGLLVIGVGSLWELWKHRKRNAELKAFRLRRRDY
jgi:hypothetical protein